METQLESVKRRMSEYQPAFNKRSAKLSFLVDVTWLIEQAEQVKQLEKQIARHKKEKYDAFEKKDAMHKALIETCNSLGADIEDYLRKGEIK